MESNFGYITEDLVTDDFVFDKLSVGKMLSEEDNYFMFEFVIKNGIYRVSKDIIKHINLDELGDAFDYKICNICNRLLPTNNFENNQIGKNNRILKRPTCKECRKNIDGIHMTSKIIKEWSLTKPDKEIFTCPICQKRFIAGVTCKVVLDHDHKTGMPRGWVCNSCNTSLGQFGDNIEILKNVIRYLESYNYLS